jgi:hypothetical protein
MDFGVLMMPDAAAAAPQARLAESHGFNGIHAGRSCDQSGGADADYGAGGFDRGQ